jgi:hypothetical protein
VFSTPLTPCAPGRGNSGKEPVNLPGIHPFATGGKNGIRQPFLFFVYVEIHPHWSGVITKDPDLPIRIGNTFLHNAVKHHPGFFSGTK